MWNRITHSLSATIFLAAVAVACAAGAVSLMRSALQVSRDSAAASARLALLTAQKERLEEERRERAGEEAVRYHAKARLNLKNPGEEIVVVLPDRPEISASGEMGLWRRIKIFFRAIAPRRFRGR